MTPPRWGGRRSRDAPPDAVVEAAALPRGERVLASARTDDGAWLLGTLDTLVVVPDVATRPGEVLRLPWQEVERADWDRDAERFVVTEVGRYGAPQTTHSFVVTEPRQLLELVRERVTASVVVSRRTAVTGRRGFVVIARQPPRRGRGATLAWMVEYDAGVDPADPLVAAAAEESLTAAQRDVGL